MASVTRPIGFIHVPMTGELLAMSESVRDAVRYGIGAIKVTPFQRGVGYQRVAPRQFFHQPKGAIMMKFVVHSDEAKMNIQLEQAADDVIVRADGMGVATFQAQDGVLRVSRQGLAERGIALVIEDLE